MVYSTYSLRALVSADIQAVRRWRPSLHPFLFPNLFAVVVYRFAHRIGALGTPFGAVALIVSLITQILTGAEISWQAEIGPGLFLEHPAGVIIGDSVLAGRNLRVGAHVILGYADSLSHPRGGCPTVGDDVQVMARASVLGPVHLGPGSVVAAHALVFDDVPAAAIARGVPARCYINGELIERESAWRSASTN
jgi:serine O-acetyltransferase